VTNNQSETEGNARVGGPGGVGFKEYFEDLLVQRTSPLGILGIADVTFSEAEKVWKAGGDHLNSRGGLNFYWFRNNHPLPHKGHLLFRFRNKLFSIFVDFELFPFSDDFLRNSFLRFAEEIDAVPCVLKMQRSSNGYVPSLPGWGLTHAVSGLPIDPHDVVSNELLEMSDTELHHQAVTCAKEILASTGEWILAVNSFSDFEPSLIVQKNNIGRWVVVRGFRVEHLGVGADIEALKSKLSEIAIPNDIPEIRETCEGMITTFKDGVEITAPGILVAVGFGSVNHLTKNTEDPKLYRGLPMIGMVVAQNLDRTDYIEPTVAMFEK